MRIILNGKQKELDGLETILELLTTLSLKPETVVVELNNKIIQPDSYEAQRLTEEDRVEIIRFVGGG